MHTKTQNTKTNSKTEPATSSVPVTQQPLHPVLQLQQHLGNQAVRRFLQSKHIQGKLTIGAPDDIYEQEADRVADQVMRMPNPVVQRQEDTLDEEEQDKELDDEQIQTKPVGDSITPVIQRSCPECEEKLQQDESGILQSKAMSDRTTVVSNEIENSITGMRGGGLPLSSSARAFMEPRFGQDFSQVRVHTDSRANSLAGSINARAFTMGNDVVFGRGQYAPGTVGGRHLLAHELTHVVQQSGENGFQDSKKRSQLAGQKAEPVIRSDSTLARIYRTPGYIVPATFLGNNVGGGVNPVMKTKLQDAETEIQGVFNSLPPAQQIHFSTGQPTANYIDWAGVTSVGGWRNTTSRHGSGSAVDLNYNTNPYIATGTVASPGGEGGPGAVAGINNARSRAIEVYQRAVTFVVNEGFENLPNSPYNRPQADVRPRQPHETTGEMYDRFRHTSDALRDYLQFAFMAGSPVAGNRVNRAPVPNVETATEAVLLAQIPLTERRDQNTAVTLIRNYMYGVRNGLIRFNPWYPLTPDQVYIRMLRDYELVRVPMEFGNVSTSPGSARNPANGFLDIRREVAIALTNQGLAWLAGDIGAHSGDIMHFDIRNHAGFVPGP